MVAWPGLLKFQGDDELIFVNSFDELNSHPALLGGQFHPGDVLIDSAGRVYSPENRQSKIEIPKDAKETLSLDSVLELVRRHASSRGECCISKISAPTIPEAIELVKAMVSK